MAPYFKACPGSCGLCMDLSVPVRVSLKKALLAAQQRSSWCIRVRERERERESAHTDASAVHSERERERESDTYPCAKRS